MTTTVPEALEALRRRPRPSPAELRTYLTGRQVQILRMVANGLTNAAIGEALGIGEESVKTHMQKALRKLGVRDRTHAVTVCLALGVLSLDDVEVPVVANSGYRRARP